MLVEEPVRTREDVLRRIARSALQGVPRERLVQLLKEASATARLPRLPTLPEAIRYLPWAEQPEASRKALEALRIKPVRSLSGIQTLAVMLPPLACSHGGCSYCPGGPGSVYGNVPQSYTGNEPASMRAKRLNYDAYLQVFARLAQYAATGHEPGKLDVIIMGGTFSDYPRAMREAFIRDVYRAVNTFARLFTTPTGFSYERFYNWLTWEKHDTEQFIRAVLPLKQRETASLQEAIVENMHAGIRIIGMSIETRPEMITHEHARELRRLGVTRVELGVQHTRTSILLANGRPHTHEDTLRASRILRAHGFKIVYHMMPGLPGSSLALDHAALRELYTDARLRPDMLKIYPTMVFPGTRLYDWYVEGNYTPLHEEDLVRLLTAFKAWVPSYVRIMRVQRDIPPQLAIAGVRISNLRQKVHEHMHRKGLACQCIRCRQTSMIALPRFLVRSYPLTPGWEYFISAEDEHGIAGFLRLNVQGEEAFVRELHVYGRALRVHEHASAVQHQGIGRRLLAIAEEISMKQGVKTLRVISGIGVREYYAKHGYTLEEPDMVKHLSRENILQAPAWEDATPEGDERYA